MTTFPYRCRNNRNDYIPLQILKEASTDNYLYQSDILPEKGRLLQTCELPEMKAAACTFYNWDTKDIDSVILEPGDTAQMVRCVLRILWALTPAPRTKN